jgi:hypothetical protein
MSFQVAALQIAPTQGPVSGVAADASLGAASILAESAVEAPELDASGTTFPASSTIVASGAGPPESSKPAAVDPELAGPASVPALLLDELSVPPELVPPKAGSDGPVDEVAQAAAPTRRPNRRPRRPWPLGDASWLT